MNLEIFYIVLCAAIQYDSKVVRPKGNFNYKVLGDTIGMSEVRIKHLVSAIRSDLTPYVREDGFVGITKLPLSYTSRYGAHRWR